jgi:hypothetical protein
VSEGVLNRLTICQSLGGHWDRTGQDKEDREEFLKYHKRVLSGWRAENISMSLRKGPRGDLSKLFLLHGKGSHMEWTCLVHLE